MSSLLITEQETRLLTTVDANVELSFAEGVSNGSPVLPALTGYDKLNFGYRVLARKGVESTLAPLIAAARQTAPTYNSPTFLNGFLNWGGSEQPLQWYMDWDGEIVIRGYINTPSSPNALTIFILPTEMAPEFNLTFAQTSNDAIAVVKVYNDGSVVCQAATGTSWLAINLRFRPG